MRKNPIELRLELLSDQWYSFASAPDARLLCWRFAASELSMVDAFFACEEDDRIGEHDDLFVPLHVPFTDRRHHGFALSAAIADEYAQSREALRALGHDVGWEPPCAGAREGDLASLIRTCASLRAYYALPAKLVLVLRPQNIGSLAAYRTWLRALAAAAPEWLRAVVLDDLDHAAYGGLSDPEERAIVTVSARLDMEGALQALSNAAGHLDTPGGQFRDLFVQLTARLGKRELQGALQLGDRALALVARHGLGPLGVPIHFALGAGLLAEGRLDEASARLAAAETCAHDCERDGRPDARATCRALRLHARLAHASALLAAKAFERAATHCEETAPLARALGDLRAELDCRRLACLAWQRAGQRDAALRAGFSGLEVAHLMNEATRATSTFEYLAKELLAVTAGARHREARNQVEREFALLREPPALGYSAAG